MHEKEGMIGRLEFIGALFAGTILGAEVQAQVDESIIATRKLAELMLIGNSIPGIYSTRLIVPNNHARFGLVHLRQLHMGENFTSLQIRGVEECQNQLRKAIIYLMQSSVQLQRIYSESFPVDLEDQDKNLNNVAMPPEGISSLAWNGADRILAKDNGLIIMNAELAKLHARAMAAVTKYVPDENRVIYEDREDFLPARIVSDRIDAVAYAFFGCAHSWENNIKQWNELYPNYPFWLVEITPHAVYRYFDRFNVYTWPQAPPEQLHVPSMSRSVQ